MIITENRLRTGRHETFYLSCGPADGPLVIMIHGWPELALSWRHQLNYFGNLGYLAVAPDMRGYGRSSNYAYHEAYSQREIIQDMRELIEGIGRDKAVWVGHDWGSPVAWNMALHHPELTEAVVSLCVPYGLGGHPDCLLGTVNRSIYPVDEFPAGQWDYQYFYYENFQRAQLEMDADPYKLVKALFRQGNPEAAGLPAPTASVRKNNGWFESFGGVPDLPVDEAVISEEEAEIYAHFLTQNTFFGPNSWYVNGDANTKFSEERPNHILTMPSLFVHATYDFVCDTTSTDLAHFMRTKCTNLTEARVDSGHWMAQEKPDELNLILKEWLTSFSY